MKTPQSPDRILVLSEDMIICVQVGIKLYTERTNFEPRTPNPEYVGNRQK